MLRSDVSVVTEASLQLQHGTWDFKGTAFNQTVEKPDIWQK